jgi:multidrug efflux pump subunit AcrA (membrane-fusion protein)
VRGQKDRGPAHLTRLLPVVFFALLAVGCGKKPPAAPAAPAAAGPQITVVKPEMRPVKRVIEQPGSVQAFEETALHANLTGFVGSVADDPDKLERIKKNSGAKEWPEHDRFIDIGSRVKKDQVLARLAVPELAEELKQKDALVRQAEAEVTQAEKALAAAGAGVVSANALVAEAEAGVDRAQALLERWQKELLRIEKLVGGGVGDLQTVDETKNQLRAAEAARKETLARVESTRAAVEKAKADRDKAAADVLAAQARVEVAKAAVGEVKARQGYVEIKAPYDGVVTQRKVDIGDKVAPGARTPLFSVARIDPVRVVVQVPEAESGLVAVGQTVRLSLQTGQAGEQEGKVIRTSWSLEPGSRTLRTEIDMPNPNGSLRPGMYAYARLAAELPAAWSVPAAAVGKVNDEPMMYLAEGGKAVRVRVELLRGDSQFTQIRRYKKPGASDWTEVTGSEAVATPAAALTDGQALP